MGRTPCCSKVGLNRGPWTSEEDNLLAEYIHKHGEGGWRTLPKKAGLVRCGKSCRLRWMNYLRPDVKRGEILPHEEDLILRLHRLLGNRWSLIAGRIPGRTDNEIKNYWNTHLSRKLVSQGIDPRTHKSLSESELDNHDNNNIDPENKLSREHKYPQTSDNIQAASKIAEYQHFPELVKCSELPETSVTDSLNQHACNAAQTNPTFLPYCNSTPELDLQDHDASLYLRRNSITNSYFVAPRMEHSDLQNISSFPGSICENPPFEGFPLNFEPNEMQQRQMLPGNPHPITQGEDDSSDIFSYFLDAFINEYEFQDQTNRDAASSLSENRQHFTPNPHGY